MLPDKYSIYYKTEEIHFKVLLCILPVYTLADKYVNSTDFCTFCNQHFFFSL